MVNQGQHKLQVLDLIPSLAAWGQGDNYMPIESPGVDRQSWLATWLPQLERQ
jgi:hypothetical protein